MSDLYSIMSIVLKSGLYLFGFIAVIVVGGIIFSKGMNKYFSLVDHSSDTKIDSDLINEAQSNNRIEPIKTNLSEDCRLIRVARKGSYISFCIAFITAILSIFELFGRSRFDLIDTVLFTIIGLGLYKMSRVAAVAGLLLFSFDKIYDLTVNFTFPQIFIYFIILISFVNAIRATFAYHKLAEKHMD